MTTIPEYVRKNSDRILWQNCIKDVGRNRVEHTKMCHNHPGSFQKGPWWESMKKLRRVLGTKSEEKRLKITASSVDDVSQSSKKILGVDEEISVGIWVSVTSIVDASLLVDIWRVEHSGIQYGGPIRRKRRYPGVALWRLSRLYNLLY